MMPFESRWRQRAAPLIEQTLRDLFAWNPDATEKEAREVLRHFYPFGVRRYHPYKMWLLECKAQLNAHYRPGVVGTAHPVRRKRTARPVLLDANQRQFFIEE